MAKKWLDSIEKQKKEKAMFVSNRQTDIHTDIQTESTTKNNRLLGLGHVTSSITPKLRLYYINNKSVATFERQLVTFNFSKCNYF